MATTYQKILSQNQNLKYGVPRVQCPKCEGAMEYQGAEPDVGIMSSSFICTVCGHTEGPDHGR